MDKLNKKEKKVEEFSDLLDSLENTEDKRKMLWKEIYENALTDRENARVLFTDLLMESQGNAANHAMFGTIMSKYLERMAKSNDQIIKLAELISSQEQSAYDPDEIFRKIGE